MPSERVLPEILAELELAGAGPDRVTLLSGTRFQGALENMDEQQQFRFRVGEQVREIPQADLTLFGEYRDVETGPQLALADGSVLRADLLQLEAGQLWIGDAAGLGRGLWSDQRLPLPIVRGVLLQPPANSLARDKSLAAMLAGRRAADELLLLGGETLRGTVLSIPLAGKFAPENPSGKAPLDFFMISLPGAKEPLKVAAGKVAAILFRGDPAPIAPRDRLVVGFRDGSLLQVQQFQRMESGPSVKLVCGQSLQSPLNDAAPLWRQITLVQNHSPRVTYLSDLPILGYKQIPFLSLAWRYGADKNVLGGRPRSGGCVALKGIGMHSASRLAYDLGGEFDRLEAELALDDQAGLRGSVIGKILVEREAGRWTTVYESPVIRGGDKPAIVTAGLKNAQRVALLIEFADHGDECDYANWLNIRVIKSAP